MYQRRDFGFDGGGAIALTFDTALTSPSADALRGGLWRETLADLDLVIDLGRRIGSARWWRGFATCAALCAGAVALCPPLPRLVSAGEPPMGQAEYRETLTIGIRPLALGGDTGRRMAPTALVEHLADTPERPRIELTATLGQGDGFVRSLGRAGVSAEEADRAGDLVSQAIALGDLAPGTRVDLVLGRRPNKSVARPLENALFRASLGLKLAVERVGAGLQLKRMPIPVDDTPLRIRGRVGSGLYLAARAGGAPGHAVETYLKALGTRVRVGDMASSDEFDLIVAHRQAADGLAETGELLYAGLDQGRRRTQLLPWTIGGRTQWVSADGEGERTGGMTRPVAGHLTSSFGMRFHPILGYSRMHQGIDLGAPYGSPIVAAAAGTVNFAGWHGGHGNYVQLTHGGGIKTGYGHMSRFVVRAGTHVAQGQLIGYVGSTGLSTGPHLHYEVFRNNVAVNPATFAFSQVMQLAGGELQRFKARLASLLAVRSGVRGGDRDPSQRLVAEVKARLRGRG